MAQDGSNSFDSGKLAGYLDELDVADDELLACKIDYVSACKPIRAHIKDIMNAAKEAGVNMRAFSAIVSAHRSDRKVEARIAKLEMDDRADYEEMQRVLGDYGTTPLGEAALAKVRPQQEDEAPASHV